MYHKALITLLLLSLTKTVSTQNIFIDESFEDWNNIAFIIDDKGDNSIIDLFSLQVFDNSRYLFVKFEIDREVNLQNDNLIQLLIDFDSDPSTGNSINGMGVDFSYNFGSRSGLIGNNVPTYHNDIRLLSCPTVTSPVFELSIDLDLIRNYTSISDSIYLVLRDRSNGGDVIPSNNGFATYQMISSPVITQSDCSLAKAPPTDFRIVSYNVQRDNIFESSAAESYKNILNAVDADIYCFQEVYNRSALNLQEHLENLGILDMSFTWYAAKDGPDLITVSKYPIIDHQEVDGNSVVKISLPESDLIVFNCHLPCCDNDNGRNSEIDAILGFLGASRRRENNFQIEEKSPLIILGDMNFVGQSSQLRRLMNGDIVSNFIYGPDIDMDYGNGPLEDLKPYTCNTHGVYTWLNDSSSFPAGRLDYMMFTGSVLESINSYVLDTRVLTTQVLNTNTLEAKDSETASDHLPMIADFRLTSMSTGSLHELPKKIKIYPNPGSETIYLETDEILTEINLYDANGNLIRSGLPFDTTTGALQLGKLPKAVYNLSFRIDGRQSSRLLYLH